MCKKPIRYAETIKVVYDRERWNLLKKLREKALKIMKALEEQHIYAIVHGSIARGDVNKKSDIDIFIPNPPASLIIETALERANFKPTRRLIIQATPSYAIKAYIELDEQTSISFPLCKLRKIEREFYKFGGEIDLEKLKAGIRVPGVDKRLMLIEPTEYGHIESSIIGRESEIAKILSLSLDIVLDRVRALLRRDEIGRTGVFLKRELAPDEGFEAVLNDLAKENPAVRRRLRLYGF